MVAPVEGPHEDVHAELDTLEGLDHLTRSTATQDEEIDNTKILWNRLSINCEIVIYYLRLIWFIWCRTLSSTLKIVDGVLYMFGMDIYPSVWDIIDSFGFDKILFVQPFIVRKGLLITLAAHFNRAMYTLITCHGDMLFGSEDELWQTGLPIHNVSWQIKPLPNILICVDVCLARCFPNLRERRPLHVRSFNFGQAHMPDKVEHSDEKALLEVYHFHILLWWGSVHNVVT